MIKRQEKRYKNSHNFQVADTISNRLGKKFDYDHEPNFGEDFSGKIHYSAYVYRITITSKDSNIGLRGIYIGAHVGNIYDPYKFSIKLNRFLSDIKNHDNTVYFEILKKGTEYDMFDLENMLLVENNAAASSDYYNATNGGSRYNKSWERELYSESLVEKLKNGEFDEYIKYISTQDEAWLKLAESSIQVRAGYVSDPVYTGKLANTIDQEWDGNTSKLPPILIFDGLGDIAIDETGKFLTLIDGNQRGDAVYTSKEGKVIKAIVLPKKIWGKLTGGKNEKTKEIIDLAYVLNPLTDAPLEMKPEEIATGLFNRSKSYEDISSENATRWLTRQRRVGKQQTIIIRKAQNLWDNREAANEASKSTGTNMIYHDSKTSQGKAIIKKELDRVRKNHPNATVVAASSSTFGIGNMENIILKQKNVDDKYPVYIKKYPKDQPHSVIVLIHHGNTEYSKEWESGKSTKDRMMCEGLIKQYGYILEQYGYINLIAPDVTGIAD